MVVIFGALNDFVEGAVNRDPWHVQHVVRFSEIGGSLEQKLRFDALWHPDVLGSARAVKCPGRAAM